MGAGGQITVYNGGTAPATIYVDVAGYYQQQSTATVPGAPTGVSAIAGAGLVSLRWTAPVLNGGSALTGYRITATPGGSTLDVTATTSAVFAGLTNGTAYTFTVSARNAIGIGPAGAASAAVTPLAPAVPGAPGAVTAVARTGPPKSAGSGPPMMAGCR